MCYDCRGYEFILFKQSGAFSPVIKEALLASFVTLLHSYILLKGHSLLLIDMDEKTESSTLAPPKRIFQLCALNRHIAPQVITSLVGHQDESVHSGKIPLAQGQNLDRDYWCLNRTDSKKP